MKQIAKLLASGKLKLYISDVFAFKDIPAAHDKVDSGKTRGKIVIEM